MESFAYTDLGAYFSSLCNRMVIPFQPEWNGHSIPAGMRASNPTGMEWLHSIPARMEWPFHSIQKEIAMRVTNIMAVTL